MDTSLLKQRIRRGRAWLSVHTQDHCQRVDRNYNPEEFEMNLKNYEMLVDQLLETGGVETDCFKYDGTESNENGELTDYEVEFILSYPALVKS